MTERVNKSYKLGPLRPILAEIGWSDRELARRLNRPHGTVRRWIDGSAAMPDDVQEWLEKLVKAMRLYPEPGTPMKEGTSNEQVAVEESSV